MSGEPRIRYAKTADGVSIAYYAMGSGPAVVDLGPPPASQIRMELQIPKMREWYERFAAHRMFVRLDGRRMGSLDGSKLRLSVVRDTGYDSTRAGSRLNQRTYMQRTNGEAQDDV